jgi:hypothetical protein
VSHHKESITQQQNGSPWHVLIINNYYTCKIWHFKWQWLWRMESSGMLWCYRHQLAVMANVPSAQNVTQMMEALSSSETSVLTRATQRNIPEDAILQLLYKLLKHNNKNTIIITIIIIICGCYSSWWTLTPIDNVLMVQSVELHGEGTHHYKATTNKGQHNTTQHKQTALPQIGSEAMKCNVRTGKGSHCDWRAHDIMCRTQWNMTNRNTKELGERV